MEDVEDVERSVESAEKPEGNNLSWDNDSSGNSFFTASLDNIAAEDNYGLSEFCDPDAGQQSDCNLPNPIDIDSQIMDCLKGDICEPIANKATIAGEEHTDIPEPSSTAGIMILGGLGAIATLKRKRKQEK